MNETDFTPYSFNQYEGLMHAGRAIGNGIIRLGEEVKMYGDKKLRVMGADASSYRGTSVMGNSYRGPETHEQKRVVMKISGEGLLVLAATIMSFISVQNVCAVTVTGTIWEIFTQPNMVIVMEADGELVDVYGVRIKYLANWYNIDLNEVDDVVSFDADLFECRNGETVLKASSITVAGETIDF